ncbi:S8 family peptidase [Ruficoccus sp. ZRK36]|uniref:S8 family peptidase n=1 Tax=Ruficoccus sp. ZRK36 TaxID=2866311 RepID=UPI001C73789B|nr:S8 family peptidase [Ruficoccus sp. ZRK36]QYY37321.1 S8 family peptidase [Ruficoccus sp. ZRK36]
MANTDFPHLPLIHKFRGNAKLEGGGEKPDRVKENEERRAEHGAYLADRFSSFSESARNRKEERKTAGLPEISGGDAFLLQIPDEDDDVLEWLSQTLNLEFVAEYDEGFVIVATEDVNLQTVQERLKQFIKEEHGGGKMASILEVYPEVDDPRRIERLLDEKLRDYWPFRKDAPFTLDVSIEVAPHKKPKAKPKQNKRWKPETNQKKREEHARDVRNYWDAYDTLRLQREADLEELIKHYGGEIKGIFDDGLVEFPDSFSMRIQMSGEGFTDLIKNHPNVFEITIPDEVEQPLTSPLNAPSDGDDFELSQPSSDAPSICVVDSGIQEGHRWLAAAIATADSFCFIPGEPYDDVADYVVEGGHGTRVASTCLYPQNVPDTGIHVSPFWLINARVLDRHCNLPLNLYPPVLLQEIVRRYSEKTRIYQHSIAANMPYRTQRMSTWAASIDYLSYHEDVLFIQAAGNIHDRGSRTTNPGIIDHISAGREYPFYLEEPNSRIANPAQSLQALTVGSISSDFYDNGIKRSVSDALHPSAFSRSGFGMWNSIKPEVVEYGGDLVRDTGVPPSLSTVSEVCPQMARSTLDGGPAIARDQVGTSFSAPKVAHIAGILATQFENRSPLLYRALIVNSARWPDWAERADPTQQCFALKTLGYGVPNLERATENAPTRVCLIPDEEYEIRAGEGLIFGVPIPDAIRAPGADFPVRIDVTLSYVAEPRRTRKSRRGYLGVWLDWHTSNSGEDFHDFKNRAIKDFSDDPTIRGNSFSWMLARQDNHGVIRGGHRKNGTVQKDWTVARSNELPDTFGIIVRGHKGWDRGNEEAKARFSLVVSFEALEADVRIYEEVRTAVQTELAIEQLI